VLVSLRIRLLVLVLVTVVPTVAIVLVSAREQRRLLVTQASGEATALARLVAERHQRSVDTARGLLLGMSRMPALAKLDGEACSAALAPLLAREHVLVNLAAARTDGVLFCSAAPARAGIDLSDRAFFAEVLRTGGLGIGEYVISRVRGMGAVGFGYPVPGDDGKTVAVAIASLGVSELQRELDELEIPAGAEVAVLDRRGVTICARPGPSWTGRPFDERLVSTLRSASGPLALEGQDGVKRLYDLRGVTAPDGTVAMYVVAGLPTAAILDPVNRVTSRALVGSLLASALALAAAVLMAEFMLVRRLRRLAATSQRIAAGDLSARTELPARRDELGELVKSFDEMAQALERLERDKLRNDEHLRQAQKMEAVGQLAGGVAHDFNNLLTVILSAASGIRESLPAAHPGQEDAREILHAGERAAALTRQLLAFSRRQALAPTVINLGRTVQGMERMLQRVLGEGIALSVADGAPTFVFADPGQIELAVLNLAVNARDAMPKGGRLEIDVGVIPADDPARPEGPDVPGGPLAVLAVRDTGAGIAAEIRARIFEPFFTTKGPGRGTGLGLSTVLGIVGQSCGAIRVHSEPPRGAEFRLYFPRHAGEPDAALEGRHGALHGANETILVVEDDARLRAMLRRTLSEHGYAVIDVGAVGEARAVAARGAAPALLLSDIILPEGNGVDLASELARTWRGVRVVFMSGYAGEHLSAAAAMPHGVRFLPKPFTPEVLLAAVAEALRVGRAEPMRAEEPLRRASS
jgi:signal transduction histidine kinase/ActR/RegA family two-component response regulator